MEVKRVAAIIMILAERHSDHYNKPKALPSSSPYLMMWNTSACTVLYKEMNRSDRSGGKIFEFNLKSRTRSAAC